MTGSEIRWDAATTVGNDPEGRKLMMSGLRSFVGAASVLLALAWLFKTWISGLISHWFSALFKLQSFENPDEERLPINIQKRPQSTTRLAQIWTLMAVVTIGLLRLTRPSVPFNHMSGAIPFTLFQALGSKPVNLYRAGNELFPLVDLVGEEYWEGAHDHFKGWTPGRETIKKTRPGWASDKLPEGFSRWIQEHPDSEMKEATTTGNTTVQKHIYSPVEDPLRITNLDRELLEPVARVLKDHNVPITHLVLVLMESARKDIFPFKAGSYLHEEILSSYKTQDPEILGEVNKRLSNLTPNAEKMTGERSGFSPSTPPSTGQWIDAAGPEMGGINVNGILTGSTLSFKSAIMNYCGAGPLPVNFMDEVNSENYQPCIMQVLELFNTLKENSTSTHSSGSGSRMEHIHDRKWNSLFLQSITGLYDDQDVLNKKMGFQETIYREDLDQPTAKYYHKDLEEINYFGCVIPTTILVLPGILTTDIT